MNTPTERPILFSGPMVQANREGRKQMTRRVVSPQPQNPCSHVEPFRGEGGGWIAGDNTGRVFSCPYGVPGDRLWVRERQRVIEVRGAEIRVRYEADGAESDWLPYPERLNGKPIVGKCLSYGGYREASRDTLEVTSVRVERLQDITEEDALAEGVELLPCTYVGRCRSNSCPRHGVFDPGRRAFKALWDSINASRGYGWDVNPYVWVVSYRRLEARTE